MHSASFLNKACFALFSALFLLPMAHADLVSTDLKAGFAARTYPIGAQILGTAGINTLLWGDPTSWKYGYARLGLNVATSAVVNRAGFEVQVNPISIVTLAAGYDWSVRNYTPKYLNCTIYECTGRVDRRFLKAHLVGAYQGVVLSFLARYEELRAPTASKPFFDEVTLNTGKSSGEPILTLNPALLYTINDDWRVGATSVYSRSVDQSDYTHLYGPVTSWQVNPALNILGGVGLNRSPVVQSGWAAFFVVQYTLKPGLNIADLSLRSNENYSSLF